MPDNTLSAAIKEAYASAPVDVIVYHTLELYHPSFTEPIRVVRDYVNLTATLEAGAPRNPSASVTFIAFAFDVQQPDVTSQGNVQCNITIDNVSREILAQLDLAILSRKQIQILYRQFISTDLSCPQNDPPWILTVTDVVADNYSVKATCSFGDLSNKKFPSKSYTSKYFPYLTTIGASQG